MRKTVMIMSVFVCMISLFSVCHAEDAPKYGSLQIISKTAPLKVYVNNEYKGKTPIIIENLRIGSHFVSVTSDSGGTVEAVVFEDLINIRKGELQTIVLPLSLSASKSNEPIIEKEEVIRKTRDYYGKNYGGWLVKLNYMYSSYSDSTYYYSGYYGSGIGYGIGYKFPLTPAVSLTLGLDRADFTDKDKNWYIMPLTLQLGTETPGMSGVLSKNHFGLGLSYTLTDLEIDSSNKTGVAWGFIYGMEYPSGEKDAFFFTSGYYIGNGSFFYFGGGYKWGN